MNTNLKELTKYTDFHNKMCEEHKRRTIYKVEVTRDNNKTSLTVDPTGANIGFEIHGNYDCTFEFKNFNMVAYNKDKEV